MPTSDTQLTSLVFNKLTRSEYDSATRDSNQFYICTDTGDVFLGNLQISQGSNTILSQIYKVGSLYLTTDNTETCPIASAIPGSTWALVESGKALWSGNGANAATTISAGLPNITGKFSAASSSALLGAFWKNDYSGWFGYGGGDDSKQNVYFDASKSNAIYGASDTVQPPAFVVNVWRRLT